MSQRRFGQVLVDGDIELIRINLAENEYNANSVNNITGTPNEDGSFTVHFGGDPKSSNYLHIMEGWNYAVRMYQPRKEILEGEWVFPSVKPVK